MRKYNVNENFFQTWSHGSAYVLGFTAADGCVVHIKDTPRAVAWNLHYKDLATLQSIQGLMEYAGVIYDKPAGKAGAPQHTLYITSKQLSADLVQLGLTRHKTYELVWPTEYPVEFMPAYIRGYFDGDGCIHIHKSHSNKNTTLATVSVVSTNAFCEGLRAYFIQVYGKEIGSIYRSPNYSTFTLTGAESVKSFLDHIYEGSTPQTRMARKYDKYLQFINEFYPNRGSVPNAPVDYETAEAIRESAKDPSVTQVSLAHKYNTSADVVRTVLGDTTHTKSDGRTNRSTSYITAFGDDRHLDDWADDARCKVNKDTLYHRVFVQGIRPEDAISKVPDRRTGTLKHTVTAFGETKTLTEWASDPRCKVPRTRLHHRILKQGMDPEEAMACEKPIAHSNSAEGKASNNQKLTDEQALLIRERAATETVVAIAEDMGINKYAAYDVASGKTFKHLLPKKEARSTRSPITITYGGRTQTIKQWAAETGIPYATIDRRLRLGLSTVQVLARNEPGTRLKLGKAKSVKDNEAFELATKVRQAYKEGLRGKANYEHFKIPKSRYIDIIGNRTCAEAVIWWK